VFCDVAAQFEATQPLAGPAALKKNAKKQKKKKTSKNARAGGSSASSAWYVWFFIAFVALLGGLFVVDGQGLQRRLRGFRRSMRRSCVKFENAVKGSAAGLSDVEEAPFDSESPPRSGVVRVEPLEKKEEGVDVRDEESETVPEGKSDGPCGTVCRAFGCLLCGGSSFAAGVFCGPLAMDDDKWTKLVGWFDCLKESWVQKLVKDREDLRVQLRAMEERAEEANKRAEEANKRAEDVEAALTAARAEASSAAATARTELVATADQAREAQDALDAERKLRTTADAFNAWRALHTSQALGDKITAALQVLSASAEATDLTLSVFRAWSAIRTQNAAEQMRTEAVENADRAVKKARTEADAFNAWRAVHTSQALEKKFTALTAFHAWRLLLAQQASAQEAKAVSADAKRVREACHKSFLWLDAQLSSASVSATFMAWSRFLSARRSQRIKTDALSHDLQFSIVREYFRAWFAGVYMQKASASANAEKTKRLEQLDAFQTRGTHPGFHLVWLLLDAFTAWAKNAAKAKMGTQLRTITNRNTAKEAKDATLSVFRAWSAIRTQNAAEQMRTEAHDGILDMKFLSWVRQASMSRVLPQLWGAAGARAIGNLAMPLSRPLTESRNYLVSISSRMSSAKQMMMVMMMVVAVFMFPGFPPDIVDDDLNFWDHLVLPLVLSLLKSPM